MEQAVRKTRPRPSDRWRTSASQSDWRHAAIEPVELLEFLMGKSGLTRGDLGRILGSRSSASLVLNRKRGLSKNHVRKLAGHFQVPPALFLGKSSASPGRPPRA